MRRRVQRALLMGAVTLALLAAGTVLPGARASTTAFAGPLGVPAQSSFDPLDNGDPVQVRTLSGRADLVSGGDALVEIAVPAGTRLDRVRVTAGTRDVTSAFRARGPGLRGLVSELPLGQTTITATLADGSGARLVVTNAPQGGPVFSGPLIQPWTCTNGSKAPDCSQPPAVEYLYKSTDPAKGGVPINFPFASITTSLIPYDPANPPTDVATTKTDEGNTVPFIVRSETGYSLRDQYRIAALWDPAQGERPDPTADNPGFADKLVLMHGFSCDTAYASASAPEVLLEDALGQGFAVASHALDNAGHNCNLVTQAESLIMTKEMVVERFGPIRYTIGSGCSGGSVRGDVQPSAADGAAHGVPERRVRLLEEGQGVPGRGAVAHLSGRVGQGHLRRDRAGQLTALQGVGYVEHRRLGLAPGHRHCGLARGGWVRSSGGRHRPATRLAPDGIGAPPLGRRDAASARGARMPPVRFLYIDVDTLRPDHLGCYGYHRATSPAIDALAEQGLRFDNLYASDVPCLPSRTALITGRFGIRNGVVSHGGVAADPFLDGPGRAFQSKLGVASWARALRFGGMRGTTISTFAERHSAYHWCAGFAEVHNLGTMGLETADHVAAVALDWLDRKGRDDDWFLHVHLWDPHTPYRTPDSYGDPFAGDPTPDWLTEDVRAEHWEQPGPHSAREMLGFTPSGMWGAAFPRQPREARDMQQVRRMFDGYDTGVKYADDHIARLLSAIADLGVDEETAVLVSGDHGETLGELGIYCDHHTADQHVSRVPGVLRWPGVTEPGSVDNALHYQVDLAATVLELVGARVPSVWDGTSFAESLRQGAPVGRDALVLSQGAWTAQRSVRWDNWLCMRTYHDGYHELSPIMLFDLEADPHEQHDLAATHPHVVDASMRMLGDWRDDALRRSTTGVDPLWTVLREGGPFHVRGHLAAYLDRLRETNRGPQADRLEAAHAAEVELRPPASLFA